MKRPLTPKQAVARVMASGWQSDADAERRAVALLVADGNDPHGARLMVQREIKRLQIAGPC